MVLVKISPLQIAIFSQIYKGTLKVLMILVLGNEGQFLV